MVNNSDIKAFFDTIAPARADWRFRNSYYYSYLEGFITTLIPPNRSVLEVGCGLGDLLIKLKPSRGVGIDLSPRMIKYALNRKKPEAGNIDFLEADVENPAWRPGEQFDFIVASDFLGYLDDISGFLKRLHSGMRQNSRLVLTQYSRLWEPLLAIGARFGLKMPTIAQNWLSMADIKNLLYLSGFEVVKSGNKVLFPKYIPIFSAFCNRFLVNIFPFNKLALVNYLVARPVPKPFGHRHVSIIIPARNEAEMIKKIVGKLPDLGKSTELIFIEGHSVDNTQKVIEQVIESYNGSKKIKFAIQSGRGKGDAVRRGFDMASGDILMIYDADMTVAPEDIEKFYSALIEGRGEFINGSRLVYPMEKASMRLINYIGNKFFSVVFSWLLGQQLKDTLCGTKALWKSDYADIKKNRSFFGDFDPFGDFDLLFGAARLNLKIIDLPVHYRERKYGTTNIKRWSHGWLLLKMVVFAMRKIKFI